MCAKLLQSCLTLRDLMGRGSPVHPMGFSSQHYWSGLPCPPPGDLPNPGMEPMSLMSPTLAGGLFTTGATWLHKRKLLLSGLNIKEFITSYNKKSRSRVIEG